MAVISVGLMLSVEYCAGPGCQRLVHLYVPISVPRACLASGSGTQPMDSAHPGGHHSSFPVVLHTSFCLCLSHEWVSAWGPRGWRRFDGLEVSRCRLSTSSGHALPLRPTQNPSQYSIICPSLLLRDKVSRSPG